MRVGKRILDMPTQKHGRERDRPSQRAQNVCALDNKFQCVSSPATEKNMATLSLVRKATLPKIN